MTEKLNFNSKVVFLAGLIFACFCWDTSHLLMIKKEAFHLDRHLFIDAVCWWMLVCECFSSLIQPLTTIMYTVLWEYVCISHVYVVSYFFFFFKCTYWLTKLFVNVIILKCNIHVFASRIFSLLIKNNKMGTCMKQFVPCDEFNYQLNSFFC